MKMYFALLTDTLVLWKMSERYRTKTDYSIHHSRWFPKEDLATHEHFYMTWAVLEQEFTHHNCHCQIKQVKLWRWSRGYENGNITASLETKIPFEYRSLCGLKINYLSSINEQKHQHLRVYRRRNSFYFSSLKDLRKK